MKYEKLTYHFSYTQRDNYKKMLYNKISSLTFFFLIIYEGTFLYIYKIL